MNKTKEELNIIIHKRYKKKKLPHRINLKIEESKRKKKIVKR